MEDGISGWLYHCHKTCYKKDSYCGRQACVIWRSYHYRNVISGWVDLHMIDISLETIL